MNRSNKLKKSYGIFIPALGLLLMTTACENKKTQDADKTTIENTEYIPEQVENQETTAGKNIEIILLSDDRMKFDKTEIRVKEGQTVKLTLKHTGTMPKTAMGHNFVLLKQGVSLSEFSSASGKAQAPDYDIPSEILQDVIAHTKMIGGGESVSVDFEAPQKGTYDFVCSFPGHIGIMKGKFIVE